MGLKRGFLLFSLKGGDGMSAVLTNKKTLFFIFTVLMAIAVLFTNLPTDYTLAAPNPFEKINTNQSEGLGGQELYEDANRAVYTIYVFGGIWVLGCLIVGAMLLASAGSNPQRRTGGLIAIGLALVSGVILVNAYDMMGWLGK